MCENTDTWIVEASRESTAFQRPLGRIAGQLRHVRSLELLFVTAAGGVDGLDSQMQLLILFAIQGDDAICPLSETSRERLTGKWHDEYFAIVGVFGLIEL